MYTENRPLNGRRNGTIPEEDDEEATPLTGRRRQQHFVRARTKHDTTNGVFGKCCRPSLRERIISNVAIGAALLALIISLCYFAVDLCGGWRTTGTTASVANGSEDTTISPEENPEMVINAGMKLFDELGRYVVEDYDSQPAFSNFLPALAGYYGKPLYAFYVNRGQAIASFGTESKDYPIMEFQSANKAYQNTPFVGFRTFIQIKARHGHGFDLTEPFSAINTRYASSSKKSTKKLPKRYMYVGNNEVQIQEIDHDSGIETNVTYFVLPEEDFGAFVKRTTVRNLDRDASLTFSMLDGLAKIEPAGGRLNSLLKSMGRTLEGWMGVYHPYKDSITMPFYRLSTQPSDSASVKVQTAGHWCLSVVEEDEPYLLPIVHDPAKVFDEDTTLIHPVNLYSKPIGEIIREPQYGAAKTASAFAAADSVTLEPGESFTISTFFGKSGDILDVPVIARRIFQPGLAQYKMKRAREIIQQITAGVETKTSIPLFDGHVQQMFLDNSLRGGIPSILGEVDDQARMQNADEDPRLKVFHFFSRVHGDLERDYNDFIVSPTFFSEGPVNFRDVIQNRREDVVFNPSIGSFNVRSFLSFIQADGYEPLSVEATILTIEDLETCKAIATRAVGEADGHRAQREAITGILNSGPFRPGQIFHLIEEQHVQLMISRQEFIDMVTAAAKTYPMAVFKDGFWADHWTYYMDLIDSYLRIYPDWEERLVFENELPYFFSPASVKPRHLKYVLSVSFDGRGQHVRQLDATAIDDAKVNCQKQFINPSTGWYDFVANWQHDEGGNVFKSSLICKLILLGTLKFATRDAYGMGIEYEGGHPGWNDANNGLVGMLGSGMSETSELIVLLRYIRSVLVKYKRDVEVPIELYALIDSVNLSLEMLFEELAEIGNEEEEELHHSVPKYRFRYWDRVATAREDYRTKTRVNFSGSTKALKVSSMVGTLETWLEELEDGVARSRRFGTLGENPSAVAPTYFSYLVTKWSETQARNGNGHPFVRAKELRVDISPLFLEGPTRMMKTVDREAALDIYEAVKASPLRDEALKMFTISASLEGRSFDMGREVAFAPGWLENQSVWMHLSYKFYLELLRHDLFEEFFEEMISGAMLPFMDPENYGRSLMECSSFIVSSAFEDPAVRGRGFLARLSGSTSEFLSMWVLMMLGPEPFRRNSLTGRLEMQLIPALPRWLFREDDDEGLPPSVSFKLFGSIQVTYYHSRGTEDLYRVPPSRYIIVLRDGSVFSIEGDTIPFDLADKIRRVVFVASIDVYFEASG